MDEDVDQTVVSSTFPPPPPHHANFTARNLALLALLRERVRPTGEGTDSVALSKGKQREILADQDDLPDWDLVAELTPPRVDWIEESGGYESFGEYFFVPAKRPTVEGFGVTRLMPDDPPDPKAHLQTLLHTLLHTYLIMLKALTRPPPSPLAFEPIAKPYVDRMAEVGVNMMAGVNALRETQARATLEMMLEDQLKRRREETADVKRTCARLAETLASIRSAQAVAAVAPSEAASNGLFSDGEAKQQAVTTQAVTRQASADAVERQQERERDLFRLAHEI